MKALVLTGDGINCEMETAFALEQAGLPSDTCHINSLVDNPALLKDYAMLALPGGFSFGDEVSSGKILAVKLRHALGDILYDYLEGDHLVIGVCNGFQALVKLGVLPVTQDHHQQVTLTTNRQHRFINKWVTMQPCTDSLFFAGMREFMLPIRHGEGRLMVHPGQEATMAQTLAPHIALQYTEDVNGSFMQVAGLVNEKGKILGLMPHPEAFIRWTQHPAWTSLPEEIRAQAPPGLQIFQNMVKALNN